jgi:hypothetical protein
MSLCVPTGSPDFRIGSISSTLSFFNQINVLLLKAFICPPCDDATVQSLPVVHRYLPGRRLSALRGRQAASAVGRCTMRMREQTIWEFL